MNSYEYQRLRGLKRKLYLIDLRGSCCEKCGYNKNLAALDFHHIESDTKESQLDMRKLSNSTLEWVLIEFEKCQVLCANCHRETHSSNLEIDLVREIIKETDKKIIEQRPVRNKPKCIDCNIEINYTYKRCNSCNSVFRRKVVRPNIEELNKEITENSIAWCSKKYGVSATTIKRWKKT